VPEQFFNYDFVDNNETESSYFSEEAGWSHPQSSRSAWDQACLAAIESVAAYHPLQESSQPKTQQIYDHRTKSWKPIKLDFAQGPDTQPHQEPPSVVSAADADAWAMGHQGVDIRPHFVTKEGQEILIDSGSQICAWPADPGDQIDPNIRLKAVNGNQIQCFGYKDIVVKIGRKP
jgi:hypothetical protein